MTNDNNLRRVVVTGMGIVSCIGNNKAEVLDSLKEGRSGISFAPEHEEMGFRSHVYGKPEIDLDEAIDRKVKRFMGDGAAYNHLAMEQAVIII
jgi:3-oxoacyl-[acyl-carrier-protein] synthase-1